MRILIAGEALDLPEESIRYERVSDILDFSGSSNDYSFPYNIKRTDKNYRLLGYISDPDVYPRNYKTPCFVDFNGIDSFNAVIYINSYTEKLINITIKTGVYSLDNNDVSIKSLNYDDIVLGTDSASVAAKVSVINKSESYSEYGICFPPFRAPNFYNGNNGYFCGVVNRFDAEVHQALYNTTTTGSANVIAPWPFLFFILHKIADLEKLKLSGSFIDDPEMQKLLLTSNVALDAASPDNQTLVKTDSVKRFSGVTDIVEFKKGIPDTYDNLTSWNNSTFSYTIPLVGDYNIIVELPFNKTYFEAIGYAYIKVSGYGSIESSTFPTYTDSGTLTLSAVFNATSGDVGRTIWVDVENPAISNGAIQIMESASFFIENTNLTGLNVYMRSFNPKICIQDISIKDFLDKIKKQLNLTWDINKTNGTWIIDFCEDTFSSSSETIDITNIVSPEFETNIDISGRDYILNFNNLDESVSKYVDTSKIIGEFILETDLPVPLQEGDLALIKSINRIYIVTDNGTSLEWVFHTNYFQEQKTGNEDPQTISLDIQPVEMCFSTNLKSDGSTIIALMPYVPEYGTSNMFSLGTNDYEPKLVFHRGLNNAQGYELGGNYLIASTGRYSINGYGIGTIDLTIRGTKGIYEKLFKNSLGAAKVQEVFERSIYLPAPQLIGFKKGSRYTIKNVLYILKSISIPLGKRIGQARIKLVKIFSS